MKDTNDWFAPKAMTEYFRQLYCRKETFDKKDIKGLLYKPQEMCFEKASKEFQLIDDNGKSIIINLKESIKLIERLKNEGMSYPLMKQLSQYSVNIHERDVLKLLHFGAIEEIQEEIYVVTDRAQYDENIGLCLDNHWMNELLMV